MPHQTTEDHDVLKLVTDELGYLSLEGVREIPRRFGLLDESLELLAHRLMTLEARLSPLLSGENSSAESGVPANSSQCQAGATLLMFIERLEAAVRFVDSLEQRIQL